MFTFIYWILGTFFVVLTVYIFTIIIRARREKDSKPPLPLEH